MRREAKLGALNLSTGRTGEIVPWLAIPDRIQVAGFGSAMRLMSVSKWDVIVVGAGHNGLTAAAYLSRHGYRVFGA